jgi:subtilase family serine protease
MREHKRRVLLGVIAVLFLLAGTCAPAPVSADNAKTLALSTSAPDLIIEMVTWSPEIPTVGDTVTFTVTIKNQGSGASSSHVAYYIDDTCQTSASINQMPPGGTVTKTFTWTAQAGSHSFEAVADANNRIMESDEANNAKTFAFSVLAPDLIIQDITWSPQNPSIRDKVTFTVTIKNQGNSRARCSNVDFHIDDSSRGYSDVPRLDAGATATKTFTWTAQAGSHTIKAIADILNKVSELDETNNDKTATYSTSAPDLIINSISRSPSSLSENTTVTFTVTIKNQGSGKADHSWVAYYIDDTYQTSVYINQMSPGATVTKTFTWTAQVFSQTFMAVADANDRIMESDETNNAKTASLPSLAPDLIINSITWSPSSPLIAHRVIFTVTIKNQGKTTAGNSRMYFNIDDYYQCQVDLPELDAEATVTRTFTWAARKASHTIQAVADVANFVIEGDETNNTKTTTVTFSGPSHSSDLIVQEITWSPANPSLGDTVTFTVSIKNQGSVQVNPFHVVYYIDDTSQPSAYMSEISSGATATTTFTWKAQAGSHTFKAVVDSNNIITESDETNNEKAVALSISAPDLVIQDITWSPDSPATGDMVTFMVTVKNQGDAAASRSYVAYHIDGSSRGYHDVPEIDAGATATRTFTWTAQEGSHTIKAITDMENQVPESNESNNELMVPFPPADLVIETITWAPEEPTTEDMVTFTVSIKNPSSGRAGASAVHLFIDGSSQGYENIEEIDAGATTTRTFTWTAQEGSHTIKAVADANYNVIESDESNNEKAVTLSIVLPLPAAPAPAPAFAPKPALASTPSPQQPEAGDNLNDKSSQVTPEQDIAPSLPEKPSSAPAPWWEGIFLSRWFIIGFAVLGATAIIVLLRLRKRAAKVKDSSASGPEPSG